jgi:hypothetical protein
MLSTKNFTRRAPVPKPKPDPEPGPMFEPTFAQSRSNGYIRIRRQGSKPTEPEPEPFIRPPSRSQLMAGR